MNPKGSVTLLAKKDKWHKFETEENEDAMMEYEIDKDEIFHMIFEFDDLCGHAIHNTDFDNDEMEQFARGILPQNSPILSDSPDATDSLINVNRNQMMETAFKRAKLEREARERKLYPVSPGIKFEDQSYLTIGDAVAPATSLSAVTSSPSSDAVGSSSSLGVPNPVPHVAVPVAPPSVPLTSPPSSGAAGADMSVPSSTLS